MPSPVSPSDEALSYDNFHRAAQQDSSCAPPPEARAQKVRIERPWIFHFDQIGSRRLQTVTRHPLLSHLAVSDAYYSTVLSNTISHVNVPHAHKRQERKFVPMADAAHIRSPPRAGRNRVAAVKREGRLSHSVMLGFGLILGIVVFQIAGKSPTSFMRGA